MRSLGALPKSVLILEGIGMVVLATAWTGTVNWGA